MTTTPEQTKEALEAILNVLGEGLCPIVEQACPGCSYEMQEARELASWGLGKQVHPSDKGYELCKEHINLAVDSRDALQATALHLGMDRDQARVFAEQALKLIPDEVGIFYRHTKDGVITSSVVGPS